MASVTTYDTMQEALEALRLYQTATNSVFSVQKAAVNFGKADLNKGKRVLWQDTVNVKNGFQTYNGIPFMPLGQKIFECKYGKDRHKKGRLKAEEKLKAADEKKGSADHPYIKQRKVPNTKKFDCPSAVVLRELIRFPTFKVEEEEPCKTKLKVLSCTIINKIKAGQDIETKAEYVLCLPSPDTHRRHPKPTPASATKQLHKKKRSQDVTDDAEIDEEINADDYDHVESDNEITLDTTSIEKTIYPDNDNTIVIYVNSPTGNSQKTCFVEAAGDEQTEVPVDSDAIYIETVTQCHDYKKKQVNAENTHILMLSVTDQQESAIMEMYEGRGWDFIPLEAQDVSICQKEPPHSESDLNVEIGNFSSNLPDTIFDTPQKPKPNKSPNNKRTPRNMLKKSVDKECKIATDGQLDNGQFEFGNQSVSTVSNECDEQYTEVETGEKLIVKADDVNVDTAEETVPANAKSTRDQVFITMIHHPDHVELVINEGTSIKDTNKKQIDNIVKFFQDSSTKPVVAVGKGLGGEKQVAVQSEITEYQDGGNQVVITEDAYNAIRNVGQEVVLTTTPGPPTFVGSKKITSANSGKKTFRKNAARPQLNGSQSDLRAKRKPRNPKLRKNLTDTFGHFHCDECNESYKVLRVFKNHKKNGQCRFECEQCGQVFSSRQYNKFLLHMKYHSHRRPFQCHLCEVSCVSLSLLKNHMKTHRVKNDQEVSSICDLCGMFFKTSDDLLKHRYQVHNAKQQVFECDVCGVRLSNKHRLATHKQIFHTDITPFECELCGEQFKTYEKLKRTHRRRCHKDVYSFYCQLPRCREVFKSETDLNKHVRRHNNLPTRLCDVCGQGFYSKKDLMLHQRSHNSEKKFSCPHCEFKSRFKNSLSVHVKSHMMVM